MDKVTQEFFDKMMRIIPATSQGYNRSIKENGELLETVVIEDIFMPEILKLLFEDKEKEKIQNIFDFVEETVNCDKHLRDILSITMMEILGNDSAVLKIAKKYMGVTSIKLQLEADKDLGRA
ncbi:DUF7674 family protein [Anaerosporobacter faecicola]|uniref:DUF7674 family protein n=1 Tax=Anaerosporobacter faecicola TaxID=2718714 RepID=UPI001439FF0F|nr:resolvase [Anaerosporobacter faecicola]